MKIALGVMLLILCALYLFVNVKKLIKAIKTRKKEKENHEHQSSSAGATENVENTGEKE